MATLNIDTESGLCDGAVFVESPNYDERQAHSDPEVIILHSISLPPGEYNGECISDLFCNRLNPESHPYFEHIAHLRVSSHFLIRRDGRLLQFVSTRKRAWHAGESVCLGKPAVNDFSIGIELEGLDVGGDGFTDSQYAVLRRLIAAVQSAYPHMERDAIFAHSDIAPGRKQDPGPLFDWTQVFQPPAA